MALKRLRQLADAALQLTLPLFDSIFRCRRKDIPADAMIWKLQAIPSQGPVKAK